MTRARELAEKCPELLDFIEAWQSSESKPILIHIEVDGEVIGRPRPIKPERQPTWNGRRWWKFSEFWKRGELKKCD